MAIQSELREYTCTHALLALRPAQVVTGSEGVFRCSPTASRQEEARVVLAKHVDEVSQSIVGTLPEASRSPEIQIGTPKRTPKDSRGESVAELKEKLNQKEKRMGVQEKLIVSLRKDLKALEVGNSQEIQLRKAFENRVTDLGKINREQKGEISRLNADNLLQKERLEEEIRRLQSENAGLKKEVIQLKAKISRLEGEKADWLTELAKTSDRMAEMERQLVEHKGKIDRLRSEHTEEREGLQNQLLDSEKRATEEREGLQRQLARLSEEMQAEKKKRVVMIFGNILLKSFDAHAQQHSEADMVLGECSLASLLNHMAKQQYAQTTGSVFSFFGNFLKNTPLEVAVQRLEGSINAPFFHAACEVLPTHPLFQHVPQGRKEERVIAFCRFVRKCAKIRNEAAHESGIKQSQEAIDLIVERHGNQWKTLIEEAIKRKGMEVAHTH